jgi:uncharacterized protein (TIGR03437 family)
MLFILRPMTMTAQGLVAAYAFNEGTGTKVTDASGNGNTGTIFNATWTTGKYGNALAFNGTNALITINDSASLRLTTAMTLEAWINPGQVVSQWQDVIYKGNDNYYLEATSPTSVPAGGGIVGSARVVLYGTTVPRQNTWSHLALTYDGSMLRLYVNAVLASSQPRTGNFFQSTNPLQIGGDSFNRQYFHGTIDEVRIYNVALTTMQIQTDMNTAIRGGTGDTHSPTAPTNLTAASLAANQINLSWTASTDDVEVTGYRVERCKGAGCEHFAQIATTVGTAYNDSGLVPASGYRYRVRATDAVGNLSPYSDAASALVSISGPAPSAPSNIPTYHNDLARTGLNPVETFLTPDNVNPSQFGKLFAYSVDGYVYAQPLYMAAVRIPEKGFHNVVFVATEHDSVYAFDADSNAGRNGVPLWHVSFLNPTVGVTAIPAEDTDCDQIVPEIGITGTPVIDPGTGTLYVVAMTKENGTEYVARLHALDISTGAEKPGSPIDIQASVPGKGDGGSMVDFVAKNYKQRPGLLLLNGVVYTEWSSHCDLGSYHGWILGYDAATLRQVAVYNDTPNGSLGSFWAGGAAPAADAEGNIFVISGNGTFDANTGGSDLGESFLKLSTRKGLAVADYFTPFNVQDLNNGDIDTGSSGALLLPDLVGSAAHHHLLVSAGKEGRIYLLDRDNMGSFQSGSDSQIVQSIVGAIGPLFGIPAYFNNTVFLSSVDRPLEAFPIIGGVLATSPAAQSSTAFSYPGSVPSISANGTANGIVWAIESGQGGTLHAYDAANLARELYNSNQLAARDSLGSYVKFSSPTIADGKVYVGAQGNLQVFGLLQASSGIIGAIVNAASLQNGAVAPGSLISIFGQGLAQTSDTAAGTPLPVALGGASLSINGMLAPLLYASPAQINAQVPFEVGPGAVSAVVSTAGHNSAPSVFSVQSAAPGLFVLSENHAAVQNQDGQINDVTHPAPQGTIVTAFLTGEGPVTPPGETGEAAPSSPIARATLPVAATLGRKQAEVLFAGLSPGFVGLFQVSIRIPQLTSGSYLLTITVNGSASNSAQVTVGGGT